MDNDLILGKNHTQRIVSIEPGDEYCEIFTEDEQGNVLSELVPNAYFILFNEQPNQYAKRLKGELHYKWGIKYTARDKYLAARRYWKDKADLFSVYNPKENFMVRTGYTYYKGMKHTEPTILSFDIETNGLAMNSNSEVYMITNTYRKNGILERKLFCFDEYSNQGEMIEAWCTWVREKNPSILCGHNIITYDLPFLKCVADIWGKTLKLGRDNSDLEFERYESKFRKDQSQFLLYHRIHCYGREVFDTYFRALRHDIGKKYETYGLKYIIKFEGMEDKDRVFYDAAKIKDNIHIPEELEKIKKYAEKDSDDGLKLYDLMSPALFYFTQNVPKSFSEMGTSATGSQLNALLVRSYLQIGHSIPKADEVNDFPGAISWGNPGLWKNTWKIDLNSLYPSIMLQYEVYDHNKDPLNHTLQILKYFREQRLANKKLANETGDDYYSSLEQTQKIAANSFYGFYGATGLNFNNPRGAKQITLKGQEILKTTILWATNKQYKDWNKENEST